MPAKILKTGTTKSVHHVGHTYKWAKHSIVHNAINYLLQVNEMNGREKVFMDCASASVCVWSIRQLGC